MIQKNLLRFFQTTKAANPKVAFLGLGNMGIPMTRNLVNSGYHVNGFDLSQESLIKAEEIGVKPSSTIAEAVRDVDYVVTCLPRTHDV